MLRNSSLVSRVSYEARGDETLERTTLTSSRMSFEPMRAQAMLSSGSLGSLAETCGTEYSTWLVRVCGLSGTSGVVREYLDVLSPLELQSFRWVALESTTGSPAAPVTTSLLAIAPQRHSQQAQGGKHNNSSAAATAAGSPSLRAGAL